MGIAIGDLNVDGRLDLVVPNDEEEEGLTILPNCGK